MKIFVKAKLLYGSSTSPLSDNSFAQKPGFHRRSCPNDFKLTSNTIPSRLVGDETEANLNSLHPGATATEVEVCDRFEIDCRIFPCLILVGFHSKDTSFV